jgi:hypothetical protein
MSKKKKKFQWLIHMHDKFFLCFVPDNAASMPWFNHLLLFKEAIMLANSFQSVFFLSPYHLKQFSVFTFPDFGQMTPAHDVRSTLTGMYLVSHLD